MTEVEPSDKSTPNIYINIPLIFITDAIAPYLVKHNMPVFPATIDLVFKRMIEVGIEVTEAELMGGRLVLVENGKRKVIRMFDDIPQGQPSYQLYIEDLYQNLPKQ